MWTMHVVRRPGSSLRRRRWLALPALVAALAMLVGPAPAAAADPPSTQPSTPVTLRTGSETACVLKGDGSIACWGAVPAPPPAGPFIDVSPGGDLTTESICTVLAGGGLSCWGEIGTKVPAGTFRAVSVDGSYACAITAGDSLTCWGNDEWTNDDWTWPVPPAGTFSAIDVGPDRSCAIRRDDGTLACWGASPGEEPNLPSGRYSVISGDCAIRDDHRLVCWGSGLPMSPEGTYSDVSVGADHSCALTTDGAVQCWGSNDAGESQAPAGKFRDVGAGEDYSCGIRTDDTVVCWGHRTMSPRPVAFIDPLAHWRTSRSVRVAWRATELFMPIASYDVRYRQSRWDASDFGSSHRWISATPGSAASFVGTPGYAYCFEARARDTGGLESSWSTASCTAIPLDDRALSRRGAWTALRSDAFYRSTALRTRTYGARLTLDLVRGEAIAIVATRCPTCGTVKVYLGSRSPRRVSLVSDRVIHRSVIPVSLMEPGDQDDWLEGRLTIKVVSSGRPVTIDGVAVLKTRG